MRGLIFKLETFTAYLQGACVASYFFLFDDPNHTPEFHIIILTLSLKYPYFIDERIEIQKCETSHFSTTTLLVRIRDLFLTLSGSHCPRMYIVTSSSPCPTLGL